eukprot:scaffold30729_cov111-Isochrysis_galbana.AAC.5
MNAGRPPWTTTCNLDLEMSAARPPYVIHASLCEPLARTRAAPTPSTSRGSTSCSVCRKLGMSSCSTSRIWAGGHLRASVTWIASGTFRRTAAMPAASV